MATLPGIMRQSESKGNARAAAREFIRIHDARQNNLKGFDLDIPVGKLVVVTGLSGAGKSSLVFDTLHAEGQRRYVETFSPYTRQFLELLPAPKVGGIENIRPSIAIQQGNTVKTSRSTVGTMTELCDWFKVWFAMRAQLRDPDSGEPICAHHPSSVWAELLAKHAGETVLATFEVARPEKLAWSTALAPFAQQGYSRVVRNHAPDGTPKIFPIVDLRIGDASVFVVQDRIALVPENRERFVEAAGVAFRIGRGKITVFFGDDAGTSETFHNTLVSRAGRQFRPAIPAMFSFNSPIGACPECRGFGRVIGVDWSKVIPDENKTLGGGAIAPFQGQIYGQSQHDLERCTKKHRIPLDVPWNRLKQAQRDYVINGEPGFGSAGKEWPNAWYGVTEFFKWLENTAYKMHVRIFLSRYRSYTQCASCGGRRLRPDSLCWRWGDGARSLPELYSLPVSELLALLQPHRVAKSRHPADQALDAILDRLGYLVDVGLGYLTLDRQSRTLSGGEVQRVNLTTCLGAALAETLFVLDEPSVGLHPRDLGRMTGILRRLVDQGNTVVVVEHDESVMRAADFLVEIGPGPGQHGGALVYAGEAAKIVAAKNTVSGPWLAGKRRQKPPPRRPVDSATPRLRLSGIRANNLNGLAVEIPLGRFNAICGVSGSGKSTLLNEVLARCGATAAATGADGENAGAVFTVACDRPLGEVALVDQSPVSRTPRSNAALYSGAWEGIRQRLAATPEAEAAGLTHSHFSFNSGDGRCPHCGGSGWETIEMQFLADVHVPCPVCEGRRFREEILAFKYRGKSVADILKLTIDEAREFFADAPDAASKAQTSTRREPAIAESLALLAGAGLGYLALGQPLNTLSGGEAQRLKLVRFLGNFDTVATPALVLLDEPTTGLHREDVSRLLAMLQRLVDAGHTLVVVEHHADILQASDWLLELGPEAGSAGGLLVAAGVPDVVAAGDSPTAAYLRDGRGTTDEHG